MAKEIITKENEMSDNIWKKMKYFVMGDEDSYEEEVENFDEVEEEEDETVTPIVRNEDRNIITDSYVRPRTNLVEVKNNNQNHMKVIVYKPSQYSDAEQIVKKLKS
jgi:FtsZ-interacting cell division protein YlmF